MNSGIRKAALALVNLRKSDQNWILSQLAPDQRHHIQMEILQARKKRGIHRLSFDDILQLGKTSSSIPQEPKMPSGKLEQWSSLKESQFRQVFAEASDYTLWLLFKWEALPNRTLLSTYLSEHQSRRINQFERNGLKPEGWLIELAVDWVLQEYTTWKPLG